MSQPTGRTLVHVADPERWDGSVDGVDLLPSTATAAALSDALDEAELLVVDDALAFPFESLRDVDRDIPLVVRMAAPLDTPGLEAVLGTDLLDHLTGFDLVAGPALTWRPTLARRRLPRSRHLGEDLDVPSLVEEARRWHARLDARWRPGPTPDGMPLRIVNEASVLTADARRLRELKSRVRMERDLLAREMRAIAQQQPRTRTMTVGLVARRPAAWASVLPPRAAEWTALPIGPAEAELRDLGATVVEVPAHMRLPAPAGSLDVVAVVGDLLHSPVHGIERLLAECVRLVRAGGWVLLLGEVVPDPRRPVEDRPHPVGARTVIDLVNRVSGGDVVLEDVRAHRRPGEDHHRAGLFRWRRLGTAEGDATWT